ncbi:MAG TPA: anti-sigma regulatory factor [Syntrophomonadaceae bacterium]|nr:anti-sigma regulatory factor [Syntrophomonadaceae bacterium]
MIINDESDVIVVRKVIRDISVRLDFSLTDITRIVTAASELARNIILYSGSGNVRWRTLDKSGALGLELSFEDQGPGIADIDLVMQEGYSTSGGLGLGLPGSRRLMDEMEIVSQPDQGTIITIRKWRRGY